MTEPIKLLHTADLHIGMENYGRMDPETGIHGRVMDFLRRLNDMVDYAIDEGVDVFVFAGDAYKIARSQPDVPAGIRAPNQACGGRRDTSGAVGG